MTGGYEAAREQAETMIRCLRDMSILIGERREEPVTLATGGKVIPGLGFIEDAAALETRARDLGRGLFKIIVLGEFKNGKSTLLNGMLGSKTLPAKAAPATAVITVLVHGDRAGVAIHESGKGAPRVVSWEEFVGEFQLSHQDQETLLGHGVLDRFRDIEYAQIECRHPLCANGVTLIDSPGLGEHLSRTRVATNFLKQAQAVILVLNATRILTAEEREFIEHTLGQGRLSHVFFVINRINQVNEPEEVRRWVERELAPHFRDGDTFDSDLYRRRVFFVDARAALEARITLPVDGERLRASGVPELERELERFLTGGERVAASLQSSVEVLRPLLAQAGQRIDREKAALGQPLAELEQRRLEAGERLDALAGRKAEIERTIMLFGEAIREKVYGSLRAFVEEMRESWADDSRRLMDLDRVMSIKTVLQSYAQQEARDRMAAGIAEEVQRYLRAKFSEWEERIPPAVQRDVDLMVTEVEAQVEDFQLELDEIAAMFAGLPSSPGRSHVSGARLMDLALSLEDIGGLTDAATGLNDWKRLAGRWTQQAALVMIIGSLVTGSFIMALLVVEVVQLGLHENEIKKRIRQKLGEKLHAALREQVEERRQFITESVDAHFHQLATRMTGVIQSQIDEVRAEHDDIVRRRQDERFSLDREQGRLDAIGEALNQLWTQCSAMQAGD